MKATLVGGGVLLIAIVGLGVGSYVDQPAQVQQLLVGRPECPHDWDFKRGQLPIVGPDIGVPELHDCQRFIIVENGRRRYDELYAIFAAHDLASIDRRLLASPADSLAMAAAEIYAEGSYPDLGIEPGFSCLYLSVRRGPSALEWRAKMVRLPGPDAECEPAEFTELVGMPLEVRTVIHPGMDREDYPRTVRWDWDASNQKQFLGLTCGAA